MKNRIKLAILHGSHAIGNANKNSDWDVAVLAEKKLGWDEISKLKEYFGSKLDVSEDKIDIADLNSDSPLLSYQVATHGKLIEGDDRDFKRFKIRAWKDYLNNEKIFQLRTQFLNKALHG